MALELTLFDPSLVLIIDEPASRDVVLDQLINRLDREGKLKDKQSFYEAVMHREKLVSTGIGLGVAIPHAKLPEYEDFFIAIAILKESGVDWGAVDGGEVRIVFLIGGPEKRQADYLYILSKISEMMRSLQVREKLLRCHLSEDVIHTLSHIQ